MTDKTQLLRQVHPNFIQNGEVGSIAFRPNENDRGLLSVYDGDLATPEASHKHYTEVQKRKSAGVMAVTVAECTTLALPAASSPLPEFDAHAAYRFHRLRQKAGAEQEQGATGLRRRAKWLYQPEG